MSPFEEDSWALHFKFELTLKLIEAQTMIQMIVKRKSE